MAVRPIDTNILTFDENGTGKLSEFDHATGTLLQAFSTGAAPTTYALLARYINAILVYDPTLFAGSVGLLGADGNTTYTWLTGLPIDEIDDQGMVGLLVDAQLRILMVQQTPGDSVGGAEFKVRRFNIFDPIETFTFTLPASGLGAGEPELLPMGTWQGDVGFWGCALSPDGSKVYLLTRQYIYACTLADSSMTILVDFGGTTLMGNGGLACRLSDGRLYAGVVQVAEETEGWVQSYSVNIYDAAGLLMDTKLLSSSTPAAGPTGSASFGPSIELGNDGAELWTYLKTMNDSPSFTNTADRLRTDMFHGETPTPPALLQYRLVHPPGLAASFKADATVSWTKLHANPTP